MNGPTSTLDLGVDTSDLIRQPVPAYARSVRIATYNVHGGFGAWTVHAAQRMKERVAGVIA